MYLSNPCPSPPAWHAHAHVSLLLLNLTVSSTTSGAAPDATAPAAATKAAATHSAALAQLRVLVARNLATLLPPGSEAQALELYAVVVSESRETADALLWCKLAETAARIGRLGVARYALEAGLAAAPRSVPLLERAMEVCVVCVCVCVCV